MRRRLELGDPVGRRLQGMLLDEHGLGENIGREGGRANGVVDEGFRLRVARRAAVGVDALEQTGEHLAFFGGHVDSPLRALWPAPRIWRSVAAVPRRPPDRFSPILQAACGAFAPLLRSPDRLGNFRNKPRLQLIVAGVGALRVLRSKESDPRWPTSLLSAPSGATKERARSSTGCRSAPTSSFASRAAITPATRW